MFKRIFWVGVGVTIGIVAVTKAQAYVKFNATRRAREAELNRQYIERAN